MPRVNLKDSWISSRNTKNAPDVTRKRMYLETMQSILPNVQSIYIMDENNQQSPIPLLNLSGGQRAQFNKTKTIDNHKEDRIMKKLAQFLLVGLVLAAIVIVYDGFFLLEEGQQSVITQFGAPVSSKTEAGIHFKKPFFPSSNLF